MRRYAVALALLTAACTGGGGGGGGGGGPAFERVEQPHFPPSLGACHGTTPPRADARDLLTRPGVWLRVDAVSAPRGPERRTPAVVATSGRYVVTGGDPEQLRRLPDTVAYLTMWNTTAQAIDEALRLGGTVSVHTGGRGDPREVAYAVARRGDETAFLGECAYDTLTVPVRERWPRFELYLRAIEGKPAADVERLLAVPPGEAEFRLSDHESRFLGEAPASAGLRKGWFTAGLPASWRGRAELCPVIELGRAGCVTARGRGTSARIAFYFDPRDPRVELRLYLTTAPRRQVAVLGTVDVGRLAARAGADAANGTVLLHVDLAASPSLTDVVADPRLAPKALVRARVAECTVRRCSV